jgi:formate hydrogenlyase subunit 4
MSINIAKTRAEIVRGDGEKFAGSLTLLKLSPELEMGVGMSLLGLLILLKPELEMETGMGSFNTVVSALAKFLHVIIVQSFAMIGQVNEFPLSVIVKRVLRSGPTNGN